MRTVKKDAVVITYECLVYDRESKTETSVNLAVVDGFENISLGDNQVLLEKKEIKRENATFELSPEQFFKYANCVIKE